MGGRSNQKIQKTKSIYFAFGRTLPTQSTGPQKQFFTEISVSVAQIKIIKKTKSIYFLILLLGGPSPTSQLVPNPFNWSPKTVFYRNLSIGRSNQKNQKQSPFIF